MLVNCVNNSFVSQVKRQGFRSDDKIYHGGGWGSFYTNPPRALAPPPLPPPPPAGTVGARRCCEKGRKEVIKDFLLIHANKHGIDKDDAYAKLHHVNKYEFINMTQKTKYSLILKMLKHKKMMTTTNYLYLKQGLLKQKRVKFPMYISE